MCAPARSASDPPVNVIASPVIGPAVPVGRKVTKGLSETSGCCAPAVASDAAIAAVPRAGQIENRSTTWTPKRDGRYFPQNVCHARIAAQVVFAERPTMRERWPRLSHGQDYQPLICDFS